jgi:hypothetical protein
MTQQRKRPLFREHALQHYMNRRENDILPRIVSPPVFLFVWLLFGLVIVCGFFAWTERVPVFVHGSGVAQIGGQKINAQQSYVNVLIFVPFNNSAQVRTGVHGRVQFGSSSQNFNGTITNVDRSVLSPVAIRKQYMLTCRSVPDVIEPSITAHMRVIVPSNMSVLNGNLTQAQLQTGSQRILDVLPVFQSLSGDS